MQIQRSSVEIGDAINDGPYRFVKRDGRLIGVHMEREPTLEEANDMVMYFVGLQDWERFAIADFLHSLPKTYGETFYLAQEKIPWLSLGTMENYRMLGGRCPFDMRRIDIGISFSHHMAIYVNYGGVIPDDEKESWMDKLEEQIMFPEHHGHMWGVKALEREITAKYNGLPRVEKGDREHELLTENTNLKTRLQMAEGTLSLLETVIRDEISPILQSIEDAQVRDVVLPRLKAVAEQEVQFSQLSERVREWSLVKSSGGGYDVMAEIQTENGDATMFTFEANFPEFAKDELARRLR